MRIKTSPWAPQETFWSCRFESEERQMHVPLISGGGHGGFNKTAMNVAPLDPADECGGVFSVPTSLHMPDLLGQTPCSQIARQLRRRNTRYTHTLRQNSRYTFARPAEGLEAVERNVSQRFTSELTRVRGPATFSKQTSALFTRLPIGLCQDGISCSASLFLLQLKLSLHIAT